MIYNELMSDFEMDEKDFAADSWSLAVDSSFLQQHKKEVMKQQDVIYGEPRPPAAPPSAGPRPRPLLRRTRPQRLAPLQRGPSARPCPRRPAPLQRGPLSPSVSRTLPGIPQVASRPPTVASCWSPRLRLCPFLPVSS